MTGKPMKTLMAICVAGLVVTGNAADRSSRIGLYIGERSGSVARSLPPMPPMPPDDWREVRGVIYNVAVKRRAMELADARRPVNGVIMPSWRRIQGSVVKSNNGQVEIIENRRGEQFLVVIKEVPKTVPIKLGEVNTVYAYLDGADEYIWGKPLTTADALAKIEEQRTKAAEKARGTNETARAEAKAK